MKDEETHELIMELRYGAYGGPGSVVNVSPLGYGELAEEYEEVTGNTFYHETEGRFSKGIYVQKILKNGTFIGVLDDQTTPASIPAETLKEITNIDEILLNEFLTRLETETGKEFTSEDQPDFDIVAFARMIKKEPYYFNFDGNVGGYFERPSTIEASMGSLQSLIDYCNEGELDEDE